MEILYTMRKDPVKDLNYKDITLINEKEKEEKGIIRKTLDVAVPVGAGMLAYKAMGAKPTPTSIGAASNARASTGGTGTTPPQTPSLRAPSLRAPRRKVPGVIPPEPPPEPKLRQATAPTDLKSPDNVKPFAPPPDNTANTLGDPEAYKSPKVKNSGSPMSGRGQRKHHDQTPSEISLKPTPSLPKNRAVPSTGKEYTPGTVGHKPTEYTPAQIQKQNQTKQLASGAMTRAHVGAVGSAALAGGGGGAFKAIKHAGGIVPAAKNAFGAARKFMDKPIKPLQVAADKTGKIGKAVIPTTPKSLGGYAATDAAVNKVLEPGKPKVKSQKSKVKKTYRQHVQGIRN